MTGILNTGHVVILVTYGHVATPALVGLTFRCAGAMLLRNREHQSGVHLTSGVSLDYTTNLRCTLSSSVIIDPPSGHAAGRLRARGDSRLQARKDPCWQPRAAPQLKFPVPLVSLSPVSRNRWRFPGS